MIAEYIAAYGRTPDPRQPWPLFLFELQCAATRTARAGVEAATGIAAAFGKSNGLLEQASPLAARNSRRVIIRGDGEWPSA